MRNFSSNYSIFILHIKNIFPNNAFIEELLNETIEKKLIRVNKFNDSLYNITLFNYFLKNKLKLFSHKEKNTTIVSESLFGSTITLKKIFNNQEESVKLLFWNDLKKILLYYNKTILLTTPNDKKILDRIKKLEEVVNVDYADCDNADNNADNNADYNADDNDNNDNADDNADYNADDINIDVDICKVKQTPYINPKTSLNKILKTENLNGTTNNMIDDIFSTFEKSVGEPNSNPFSNIMEISQIISDKYKSNIENGDINLDDLLANMTNLPGMENMGGIISSLTKQIQPTSNSDQNKIIIDENFSTSNVIKGEESTNSSGFNVGNILKTMDSFSSSMGNNKNSGNEDNMSKMMDIFSKLGNTSNQSELNNIIENELGIDMKEITNEISKSI